MKKIKTTLAASAVLILAACNGKRSDTELTPAEPAEELVVEKGEIQGDTLYINQKPYFSFAIDTSWHIIDDNEMAVLQQNAARFVEGKAILDGSQSVVVFMAKQFETGVPLDINDSFMCAVNGHDVAGEHFNDAVEYIDYITRTYSAMLPADIVSKMDYKPVTSESINGKKLEVLEMEIKLDEEKTLVERHYVHFDEKYILDFTIKFSPQEEHEAVLRMLNSIAIEKKHD